MATINCGDGGLPGYRNWTLIAYDENGEEIFCEGTPTGVGANLSKYALFVQGLKEEGYTLQKAHHVELKQKLGIVWGGAWDALIANDANLMNKAETAMQLVKM